MRAAMKWAIRLMAWGIVVGGAPQTEATPVTLNFDNLGSNVTISNQYQSQGVVFSVGAGAFVTCSANVSISCNPVSQPNSVVFYHPLNLLLPVTVTATFFDPISGLPSPTDYVGFTPTDASDFTTTLIMRAYNSANVLIGTASRGVDSGGTYNPGVDTPVSLSFAGIARVELTGTVQTGANFGIEGDDFRFDTPAPVNTVPEPATWLLLGSSVAGLVWRKWVRRGNPGSEAA